jgi:hypothetical protein
VDGCTVTLAVVTRLYISSLIPPLSLSCLLACLAKGSFFSRKKITFAAYEYKFVMALGMASIESVKMQSRIGDRGGIDCIIGLCCAVLCCAVLCCAVMCCDVLCCVVLYCAVLCCVVLYCTVLCCAVMCCVVLCCDVLYLLCCVVLYCAVL